MAAAVMAAAEWVVMAAEWAATAAAAGAMAAVMAAGAMVVGATAAIGVMGEEGGFGEVVGIPMASVLAGDPPRAAGFGSASSKVIPL